LIGENMSTIQTAKPLVSVILPTHNRVATLARAIRSVLDQTFKDIELIIVDDGSTDGTSDLLRGYIGRDDIKIVASTRRGAAGARNLGASLARGCYLAFQDSDDEWVPDKLERSVAAFRDAGPETAVVYGDMIQVLPDGSRNDFKAPTVEQGRLIDDATNDFQVMRIGIQAAVIKRECFEAAGGFDEALPRYIDMELFARLALRHGFIHLDETVAFYHAGPGISTNRTALVAARQYLLKKYIDRLRTSPRYLAWQYIHLAEALGKNGEKLRSIGWVVRAWSAAPREIDARRCFYAMTGRWSRVRNLAGIGTATNHRRGKA
jgi:glycosyltransferase involved in cell wall biosynthesis